MAPALVLLGTTVTRGLVPTSSVFNLQTIGLRGLWEHSIGCPVAKVTQRVPTEEASAAGLLHDLGEVIIYPELPEDFSAIVEERGCSREASVPTGNAAGCQTRWGGGLWGQRVLPRTEQLWRAPLVGRSLLCGGPEVIQGSDVVALERGRACRRKFAFHAALAPGRPIVRS